MNDIKVIFFDIDGTLLALDKDTISEKTKLALNLLQKNNIKICIATGRSPVQIPHFDGVDFDFFISYNGSLCFNKDDIIFSNPLAKKDVLELVKNAKAMNKPIALGGREFYVGDYFDDDLREYFSFSNFSPDFIDDVSSFVRGKKVYQINMPIRKDEYERALLNTKKSKISAWWEKAVDIIPKDGGKGKGLREVLSYYGIDKENALAFGDGDNDIDLFKEVRGISMGNGSDNLKKISFDLAKSVDDDGIYYYLKDKKII